MTEQTSNTVKSYLSRLDAALAGVDPDVRFEIVSGIREELAGLDDDAAAARIAEMDDPALIAAEARAEMPPAPAPPVAEAAPGRTFSIAAVLVLIIGTFVVPIIGPLVGLVWVSMAKAWTRREKIVAWVRPFAAGLIVLAISFVASLYGQNQPTQAYQPTLPFAFVAQWHFVFIVMFVVLPIEGIVLLVRANKRGWRAPSQP
jgi:cytochrome b561